MEPAPHDEFTLVPAPSTVISENDSSLNNPTLIFVKIVENLWNKYKTCFSHYNPFFSLFVKKRKKGGQQMGGGAQHKI